MSKSNYSEIDLDRQTNYIIVVSPENERDAFEKTILVAYEYIKKDGEPKVVVLSQNYKNTELKKILHTQVQTFKKGTIRIVDRSNEIDDLKVIERISALLKNGMIVIDDKFLYSDEMAEKLLNINGRAQDHVIHRNEIQLLNFEIDYIRSVFQKIENHNGDGNYIPEKNIILRLHYFSEFQFTKEKLQLLTDNFGRVHGFNIMLAYFISRKRTVLFRQELIKICDEKNESPANFINPKEFKRQTKNYVYYNIISGEIMSVEIAFINECVTGLMSILEKEKLK